MLTNFCKAIFSSASFVDPNNDFSLNVIDNDFIENQTPFSSSFEREQGSLNFGGNLESDILEEFSNHPLLSNEEEKEIKTDNVISQAKPNNEVTIKNLNSSSESSSKQKKIPYFKVVYAKSDSLFTKTEMGFASGEGGKNLVVKKRLGKKRKRKENKDNILKKIKRGFLNNALINKLNHKLKNIQSKKYFMRFPQFFVCDVEKKRNKELLSMKLRDIFEKKKLYINEKKVGLNNYKHNLKVVQSEEIMENKEFKKIMNKTFSELYEEYINSDDFKIGEIKRLKRKKMKEEYIQRYIIIAKALIKFFSL